MLVCLQPITAKGKTRLIGFNFDGLLRASGLKGHYAGNAFSPGVAGADNLLFPSVQVGLPAASQLNGYRVDAGLDAQQLTVP